MSRRRCYFRCDGNTTLYALPKSERVRNQWFTFMFDSLPVTYNHNLYLCPRHFSPQCFVNGADFESGRVQRLILRDGAVPSLMGSRSQTLTLNNPAPVNVGTSQPMAVLGLTDHSGAPACFLLTSYPLQQQSTSQQDISPTPLYTEGICKCDVGCQTDILQTISVGTQYEKHRSRKSVGTQLSMGTLKDHVRSKAVQASVSSANVSTETTCEYQDVPFGLIPPVSPSSLQASAVKRTKKQKTLKRKIIND